MMPASESRSPSSDHAAGPGLAASPRRLPEWGLPVALAVACLALSVVLRPLTAAAAPELAVGLAAGFGLDPSWVAFHLEARRELQERHEQARERGADEHGGDAVESAEASSDPWGQPWIVRTLPSRPQVVSSPTRRVRLWQLELLGQGKPYSRGPDRLDEQGLGDDITWPAVQADPVAAAVGRYVPLEVLRAPRAWLVGLALAFLGQALLVRACCPPLRGPWKAELGRAAAISSLPCLLALAWAADIVGQRWVTELETALGPAAPVTGLPVAVACAVAACLFGLALARRSTLPPAPTGEAHRA